MPPTIYRYPTFKKENEPKKPDVAAEKEREIKEELDRFIKIDKEDEEKAIEEGKREAAREITKESVKELPDISRLESLKDRELFRIRTVFPFVFFPDLLIVEENKLTFIWGIFFGSKDVRSVLIKDIANISVSAGIFLAKLEVVDKFFAQDPLFIDHLPRGKAFQARRIIQGLIVAARDGIDFSDIPIDEVKRYAIKLGEADSPDNK